MAGPLGYHRIGSVFPRAMLRKAYPAPPRTTGRVAFLVSGPSGDYTMTVGPGVYLIAFSDATIFEGIPEHADYVVMPTHGWPEIVTAPVDGVSNTMAAELGTTHTFAEYVGSELRPAFEPFQGESFGLVIGCDRTISVSPAIDLSWMVVTGSRSTYGEWLESSTGLSVEFDQPEESNRSEEYAVIAQ